MRPSAAFSVGLWTGAAVVAAIGWYYFQGGPRAQPDASHAMASDLAEKSELIRLLQQDNARLTAETQRLKETVTELKSNLESRATLELRRRVPFAHRDFNAQGTETVTWIEEAVVSGKVEALPRLEVMALDNDASALEALVLLAGYDRGATLTRVWNSGSLSFPNKMKVTRFLASILEVNPRAAGILRNLVADPNTDVRLLYSLVDGLANPKLETRLGKRLAIETTPQSKPDFATRLRMLDNFRPEFVDEKLRAHAELARDELLGRWAEAEQAAP